MKSISFSRTLRTIGLTTILTVVAGTQLQQVAQAQFGIPQDAYMPCSEAYFADRDFAYWSDDFMENLEQRGQLKSYEQDMQRISDEMDAINATVTVFTSELDSPIGYVANIVNGVAVEISPEVEKSIQEDMYYPYSRAKVKLLNEKYSEYATFGQQISLMYTPAQTLKVQENLRQYNVVRASYLTPEEKQEYRDRISSQAESCTVSYGFADMAGLGSITITVGERPDLDAKLREDTTGATFFR